MWWLPLALSSRKPSSSSSLCKSRNAMLPRPAMPCSNTLWELAIVDPPDGPVPTADLMGFKRHHSGLPRILCALLVAPDERYFNGAPRRLGDQQTWFRHLSRGTVD